MPGAGADAALIDEIFHALNQPLTSLQCLLELSLLRPRAAREYRLALLRAQQQAEEIARLASGLRELLQASGPGNKPRRLSFTCLLHEVAEELQPVAESLQIELSLRGNNRAAVCVEPRRMRQALFSLLDLALSRTCCGTVATLRTTIREGEILLSLKSRSESKSTSGSQIPFVLPCAVARRIVETAGGSLQFEDEWGKLTIELRLPLLAVASQNLECP